MAQARVEIVFSERREGASVSKEMLRDLDLLKRQQSNFKGFKQISPKVDTKALHDLNNLLDVKQRHIQETAQFAAAHPLIIQARMAGFDEVMGQIEQLQRAKGGSINTPPSSPGPGFFRSIAVLSINFRKPLRTLLSLRWRPLEL
ncbi:MAG: hypothetical protein HC771_16115 [Synechococcales cyanobacterium CRU_2_2]|nr:hypothetical protein [Synechococcales cyanobacterium CRU_2_2]